MKYLKLFEEFIPINTNHDYWIEILNKLGYNIIDKLSGGYFGFCFLTDKNTVVKVSVSSSDAVAAYLLKNKKNEYLVDYYNVLIFKDNSKDIKEVYIIEMEYLNKNPDNKKLENAFKIFKKNIYKYHILHTNSYIRDFIKIEKEASSKNVILDLHNTGNFLIKNDHLCAIDIGIPFITESREILKKIPIVEFDELDQRIYKR